MPEAAAIDQQVNQELVPRDPGAQRAVPGSAQPHRRADLSDRNLQQREQQGLAAEGDRGAEEGSPQRRAAGRIGKAVDELRRDGPAAAGVEGREGRAAAEARRHAEARPPSCARSATSICPTASPTSAPIRSPACRTSWTNFDIRIRQIHVKDVDLVDRCESCHLGTREPVDADEGGHGRRSGLHQPSRQGAAEDPRSREVRLHALPRRQRRGRVERREGARLQQVLAVADASQGEYRSRLPAVPRRRRSSPRWPTR